MKTKSRDDARTGIIMVVVREEEELLGFVQVNLGVVGPLQSAIVIVSLSLAAGVVSAHFAFACLVIVCLPSSQPKSKDKALAAPPCILTTLWDALASTHPVL